MDDNELIKQLRSLTEEFENGLAEQMGNIESCWIRVCREGWRAAEVNQLIMQVHSLAGSASSLGFRSISGAATDVLEVLQKIPSTSNGKSGSDKKLFETVEELLHRLRQASYTDRQIDVEELAHHLGISKDVSSSLLEKRAERLIYMVEDDALQAEDLAAQVGYFGYTVTVFTNLGDLEEAINQTVPTAILMDITFPEGKMAGYETIDALRSRLGDLPPVIFISINDSLPYRLQAVRVGGKAYFTKPVDTGSLIDVLDRLILNEVGDPYRVLIVDDSRVQANYNAAHLKRAGMLTEIISDPMQVIDHMISFNPDLVLLDMYMPECNGMELASIIRQMERFISIPIVFFSAETNKEKQLAALGLGGDDFLTKPIEPEHLIIAVTTRIERYRKMRALMLQDSLTGLLNHNTTKESLYQEVERARRHDIPLSFAMIDLDHFKNINDSYGHATGDRVIKSLAHMLTQRLRSSDIVGRIGGEEFAVILPNTHEEDALQLMQELCKGFSKIHHRARDEEFSVRFSCGIASYPHCDSADHMLKTADAALYAAKSQGRNRVVLASQCEGLDIECPTPHLYPQHEKTAEASPVINISQDYAQNANNIFIRFDGNGVVTWVNPYAIDFFGYSSQEELVGQHATLFLPEHLSKESPSNDLISDILENPGQFAHCETEAILQGGKTVWLSWNMVLLKNEQGKLIEIVAIANDITDRKELESSLTRTITRLSALKRISQALMLQYDLPSIINTAVKEVIALYNTHNAGITLLNEEHDALRLMGDYLHGWRDKKDDHDLIRLDSNPASVRVIESGKAEYIPNAMTSPNTSGSHSLLEKNDAGSMILSPLMVQGKVIGTMGIDFAESERKVYPSDLQTAEMISALIASAVENTRLFSAEHKQRQYYEALIDNLPIAVVLVDQEALIVSWNPAAEKLFGYTAEEALGKNIDQIVNSPQEFQEQAIQYTRKALDSAERIHDFTQRYRKDGSLADVELVAVPIFLLGEQSGSLAIYHDITDLQRARKEAEAANEAKSAFLATMSHEIRTPLNAIIGMSTLLEDTQLNDEQYEFTETIRNSSDTLLSIINDILDFSKMEAGRMELEDQPFDLRECLENALDLVAGKASEKGIDLAYLLDPGVPAVIIGDDTRLRQILLNLLSNSVKFTEEGEVVLSVSAEKLGKQAGKAYMLHFMVRDTGIGIPEEGMQRIFHSFTQVDTSTTRKYGGTGLGLAISKRLVEMMGGTIWVESDGIPGAGSVFHFTIQTNSSTSPMPVFMNRKQPELTGKSVLIVDDNATNRYILLRQVQSWGMKPQETASPIEALRILENNHDFDVIFLDMQMPEMDGAELATKITSMFGEEINIPLIMLTSLGIKEIDHHEIKLAAYLTKPIKPAVLYTTLLEVFNGKPAPVKETRSTSVFETKNENSSDLRILLAEDNDINQKVALRILERIGYQADVAANGLEVLEALRRQSYDVILMDVQMPEMDGLETTRQVRAGSWNEKGGSDSLADQPYIIAMTANAMQGDREICLAAGMDDYISKPIRVDEVIRALSDAQKPIIEEMLSSTEETSNENESSDVDAVIDDVTFNKFHLSTGVDDPQATITLIQDYLNETHTMFDELKTAIAHADQENIQRYAHSLKSNSRLFGALQLSEMFRNIELDAQNGGLVRASSNILQAEELFRDVETALKHRQESILQRQKAA